MNRLDSHGCFYRVHNENMNELPFCDSILAPLPPYLDFHQRNAMVHVFFEHPLQQVSQVGVVGIGREINAPFLRAVLPSIKVRVYTKS